MKLLQRIRNVLPPTLGLGLVSVATRGLMASS
jgi:hypothetical protein